MHSAGIYPPAGHKNSLIQWISPSRSGHRWVSPYCWDQSRYPGQARSFLRPGSWVEPCSLLIPVFAQSFHRSPFCIRVMPFWSDLSEVLLRAKPDMPGWDSPRNLFRCINAELATKIMFLSAWVINTLISIISSNYCFIYISIFPSPWRSENTEFRICWSSAPARRPWNTTCATLSADYSHICCVSGSGPYPAPCGR